MTCVNKGLFISFEGSDGSGKTTQIRLLQQYLADTGVETIVLREPGGTTISEKIRDIILDNRHTEMDSVTEMFLYAASRAQLVAEKIKPALMAGTTVICDRFVDSSFVYQGFGRELGLDRVKAVNDIATDGVMPDMTFFLDIDPDTALKRRYDASSPDRLEQESIVFHQRVYEGYIKLQQMFPDRIKCVDGKKGVKDAHSQVKGYIDSLLCRYN